MPIHILVHFQTLTITQTSKMIKDMCITPKTVKTAVIWSQTVSKSNQECTTETSSNRSSQNRSHIVSYSSITWLEGSSKTTSTSAVALTSPHSNHTVGQAQQTTNIKRAACNKECQRSKPQSLMKKWPNFSKNSWKKISDWGMKLRGLNACLRKLNEVIGRTSKKGSKLENKRTVLNNSLKNWRPSKKRSSTRGSKWRKKGSRWTRQNKRCEGCLRTLIRCSRYARA